MQILEPGEDVKFSQPADVGASYAEFPHAVPGGGSGDGHHLRDADRRPDASELLVDPAGLLEFRRRCEAIQHGVIVHQLCRPIWRAWMEQALLEGALALPQFTEKKRDYFAAKMDSTGLAVGRSQEGIRRDADRHPRRAAVSPSKPSRPSATTPRTSTARSPPTTSGSRRARSGLRLRPASRQSAPTIGIGPSMNRPPRVAVPQDQQDN